MNARNGLGAQTWRKSSYSTGGSNGGTTCVEVSIGNRTVSVRDSKAVDDGTITVTNRRWQSFMRAIRAGTHPTHSADLK